MVSPTTVDRSPYRVTLTDLVLRFNTSSERREIFTGLLSFSRSAARIGIEFWISTACPK
jgi:hypothetical protein